MIGVIPNILVELIKQHWGYDMVDQILDDAGIDHSIYHPDVFYPDEEWERLYSKTLELTGMSRDDFEWRFGRYSAEYFKRHIPDFMQDAHDARTLIGRIPQIQNLVATTSHHADNQRVRVEDHADRTIIHYTSPNHLCTFQRSLIQWIADEYETPVEIEEPHCMKRGDHECEIHIRYLPQGD